MCSWLGNALASILLFHVAWSSFTAAKIGETHQCVGMVQVEIDEGLRSGRTIVQFAQRKGRIYSFYNDSFSSPGLAIFQISTDGRVTNRVSVDREDPRGSSFVFTVLKRRDFGTINAKPVWSACSLSIVVKDVNDNAPRFEEDLYVGWVEENATRGTLVRGLQGIYAIDPDSESNSLDRYEIGPHGGGADAFEAKTENVGGLKFLSIRTLKRLDREALSFYVLTVKALDGGNTERTTTGMTQIRINVLDVNDCLPVFRPAEYSMSVLSSTPVGTSVLKVHAQDDDLGQNGGVYYFFTPIHKTKPSFTIEPHTGVIRVSGLLGDFALGNAFELIVVAQDRGTPKKTSKTVVKVNLIKTDQASPKFSSKARFAKRSYLMRVREDLPVNCHILRAGVTHLNGLTNFTILSDQAIPFQVDARSGVLYLTKPLDFESRQSYEFRLQVRTGAGNVDDEVNVAVHVDDVDENLHTPVFARANLETSLQRKNTGHSVQVQKLETSDTDDGLNGQVKYYIRGGNGAGMFTIEKEDRVYARSGLNWQGMKRLGLLVEARDCARRWKSSMQFLIVKIVGHEDCRPEFERPVFRESLVEHRPRGTFVVATKAKDCEAKSKVTYSISSGNSQGLFTIDKGTGIVRTTQELDREAKHEHILEITARSRRDSIAQVFIEVEDINDKVPAFGSKNYKIQITENRGRVNSLICLQAWDRDTGSNGKVKYEITAGNHKNLFNINVNTGALSSDSLDFESTKEHLLTIRASDHGVPPKFSETTVKVIVKDTNDPPKFKSDDVTDSIQKTVNGVIDIFTSEDMENMSLHVSQLEGKPKGSTVIFLSVTDEDTGENGEFFCSYENIDPDEFGKFEVKTMQKGCEVRNMEILDWFGKNVYSLRVRVTDKASPRQRKSDVIKVTVKVQDINNHAPVFSQHSYWKSVPPLSTSPILYVHATDKDSRLNTQSKIEYSIIPKSPMFTINTIDGTVTAKQKLKRGEKYTLVIQAKDEGRPIRPTNVTCYISVHSQRTSFPQRIYRVAKITLREDADLKSVVARAVLRKKGKRFEIVGGNVGGAFKIGKTDGNVRLAHPLDYERVKRYKLVVRAVFKNGKSALAIEAPLEVRVTDINDNEPSFRIHNRPMVINVNQRLDKGVFIARVQAFDADSGANGVVSYDFRQRSTSDLIYFAIDPDSGKITAKTSLHRREAPYTFTVIAEDKGWPKRSAELEVQVKVHKDSNLLHLPLHQRDGSVIEGPLGIYTKVMTINVDYKGENDLTYALEGDINDSFCVDVTGTLYSARELDREKRASYNLKLSVNDSESTAYAHLNITVNDVNDNPPQFATDPIPVFTVENAQEQRITTAKAEDADWGVNGNVSYEIVGIFREPYRNRFKIDPNFGTLIITGTLDHEQAPEHVLTIAAQDRGSASYRTFGRVIVTVKDENDNCPRFVSRSFAERIPLNAPIGYRVIRALATDDDSGLNGKIRYAILSTSDMFTIDGTTGWIHVASGLSLGTISFLVSATDKGRPGKRCSPAQVNITVEACEGPPRFLHAFRGLHARVRENQKLDSVVLTVKTVSRDLVTYTIDDDSIRDFEMDPISGRILIARPLDYERRQSYNFTVSAADRNDHVSRVHVTVWIENVNNEPRIVKNATKISCRVERSARIGTRVTRIRAFDDDKGDTLRFSLSKESNYFKIASDGTITTKVFLSGAKRPELYIGVTVEDSGKPPLSDSVSVHVVLLNYDKNQGVVRAAVSERTKPGTSLPLSQSISKRHEHPSFSIVYPDVSPFSVEPIRGTLILEKPLDYEMRRDYSLTVRMEEKGDPDNYLDVDIEVAVQDENDNLPEFQASGNFQKRSSLIHKNARQGTLVYRFKATDKDSGRNGDVAFRMGAKHRELFNVRMKTGELRTNGKAFIKGKQYNVTVEAYDKGTPSLSARTFVIVHVNDPKPKFTMEEYQFEINEDAAIGYHVGTVEARSFGLFLSYELTEKGRFSINKKTGNITLLSPLDYEMSDQRIFKLEHVIAKAAETARTRVTIRVKDVNDCAPTFYSLDYSDRVPESAPIGTTVLKIHASDKDSGINAEVRYSLDTDDFIIDSYTGVVTTAATLDYETTPLYKINVTAHDRGTPRLKETTTLIVEVTNVNDNAPMFTSLEYLCSLWENVKKGTLVKKVEATDADHDAITYDITAGNDAYTFAIDPDSGVIKLIKETVVGPSYHLNVSASDGIYKEHAVVKVIIKDINDHAPVFTNCARYSPSIPENSQVGTSVLKVIASDEDLGPNGEVEYSIDYGHAQKMFKIERKTGLVSTSGKFDREKQRTYTIRVKATDGSSDIKLEGSCLLEVTITDINDNKPIFIRSYEENIKENVEIGYYVMQVTARDKDEGANAHVSYDILTPMSLFAVDKDTGIITTRAALANKRNAYELKIRARDSGVPSQWSDVTVRIDVIDSNNDPPRFKQSFYEAYVSEDVAKGSRVGEPIVATSKNSNHEIIYSIIPGNVAATNNPQIFKIDAILGEVTVIDTLDRETTPNYTLTIRAENNADPPLSSWTIQRIFVTDVNDCWPAFTTTYNGDTPENSEPGTSVLTVKAIDKDDAPYNKTLYSMSRKTSDYKFFNISSESGVIRSTVRFDRETKSTYTLVVKATDKENLAMFNQVRVKVRVTDENDMSPSFTESGSYEAEVEETIPIGTTVTTVSASDGDLGLNAMINFDIQSGNDGDKFRIFPDGHVVVNSELDYEERKRYELTLLASDGKNNDTALLTVTIKDENDNNPVFKTKNAGIHEAEVPENKPRRTWVTTLTAEDRDFDSAIMYHLSEQVARIFRINAKTGKITTLKKLDRETRDTYRFLAYAGDGERTGSVEVIVNVKDENDNAPVFPERNPVVTVREMMPSGTEIKRIEAKDKDDENQGGNAIISYSLHGDSNNYFTIHPTTAMLATKVELDRENKDIYTLVVRAMDGGKPPLNGQTNVSVRVLDYNDHAPKFTKDEFSTSIPENTTVGRVVLKLTATDEDIEANAKLTFSLLRDDPNAAFLVKPGTAEVAVASILDYEDKKRYEFQVKVQDGGNPSKSDTAKVVVDLTDSNDNGPLFIKHQFTIDLLEGNHTNNKLGLELRDQVVDKDTAEENKDFLFSIVKGDPGNRFKIDSKTGQMFVNSLLDYETDRLHVLTVRVKDTDHYNDYKDYAQVNINVKDINDNLPQLTNSSLNQEIFENKQPDGWLRIGKLEATDLDSEVNGYGRPFTFGILEGNKNNSFRLEKHTGVLETNKKFNREKQAVYPLKVWIKDNGNTNTNADNNTKALTNNVIVKIHIRDRNDNPHKAGTLRLTVNLLAQQTISPKTPVGKVFVDDLDTNDLRYYEMLEGFNIFSVDKKSGEIYMIQRPAPRSYEFPVKVSDRNSRFNYSIKCNVIITVNLIPTEAFTKSISLRFLNKTRKSFVSRLDKYKSAIAKAVDTKPENVDLFSVQNVGGNSRTVDVRFGAHGSPYYAPEKLVARLKKKRNQLTALDPEIVIGFDACASEPCKTGGCKSKVVLTGGIEVVDDGYGKSFASVVTRTDVKCGKCEEMFPPKTTCESRPCLSNDTCVDRSNEFPNCLLTGRSFKKGEWVWLLPLKPCRVSTLSLQFSSLQENGLLLYNGPMADLGTGDNYDFIAVQLDNGRLRVSLSLGDSRATHLVVKSSKLNDGKWHLVEIFRNATIVRVTVDQCRSSLVTASGDSEDRGNCETSRTIGNKKFNFLNINEELQLGGMATNPPHYTDVRTRTYQGCIRNVKENNKMYDLKAVLNSKGSREGCPTIDRHCPPKSPCYGLAECVPSRNNFSCICPPGFEGRLCDAKSVAHSFNDSSFIKYRPKKSWIKGLNPKYTKIELMVRTRDEDEGVLMLIRDKGEKLERLKLQMVRKGKEFPLILKIVLGRGPQNEKPVRLQNALPRDGQWHHVTITQDRNEVHLGVDSEAPDKGAVRFISFHIDENSEISVGGLRFEGCIKDVRLNGQTLANRIAIEIMSQDVTTGCNSTACQGTPCPNDWLCNDRWRKHDCLKKLCKSSPCRNGATCTDYVLDHKNNKKGVARFKCECHDGFNGTQCEFGANVIMLIGDGAKVNLKLVIGLSSFVFVLALATLLIICYHRFQLKGKAPFDPKRTPIKNDANKVENGKGVLVIERRPSDEKTPRNNSLITKFYPSNSMYSHGHGEQLVHTCQPSSHPPPVPPRRDSLETKKPENMHLTQLPARDIPPVIQFVLSSESDSSPDYDEDNYTSESSEDEIEDPWEIEMSKPKYASRRYVEEGPRAGPSAECDDSKPMVTWNDLEQLGRRVYTMTRNFLVKDAEACTSSGVSSASNSSSVVTVVENPSL